MEHDRVACRDLDVVTQHRRGLHPVEFSVRVPVHPIPGQCRPVRKVMRPVRPVPPGRFARAGRKETRPARGRLRDAERVLLVDPELPLLLLLLREGNARLSGGTRFDDNRFEEVEATVWSDEGPPAVWKASLFFPPQLAELTQDMPTRKNTSAHNNWMINVRHTSEERIHHEP